MNKLSSKQKELIKRILIYIIMVMAVGVIVIFVVFTIMGYRFDSNAGQIEQYALLQFNSSPTGADVSVDGKKMSSQTPNKSAVAAGTHEIKISRTGYQTWTKEVNIKSGVLKWLNYALLVPNKLTVEPVASYAALNNTLASPNGHYMLVQNQIDLPNFDLVNINSDTVKTTKLTIPADIYSDASTAGVVHSFTISKWDGDSRYVLIKHTSNDKDEWLVLDTQAEKTTKNITKLFDFAISYIDFSGTSGNIFYALGSNDVRRLDLSAGTMSRTLVNNVASFSVYGSDIITYVSNVAADTNQMTVGLYRDGDEESYTLRTIVKTEGSDVNIATARYFNKDYVAISNGSKIDILSGKYPSSLKDKTNNLKTLISLTVDQGVQQLKFSPSGEYLFMQSGAFYASYDLEYKSLVTSSIAGNGNTSELKWLNDNYIWSDRDGKLTIREFDGSNMHSINSVQSGQSVTLANNGRYLYSINKIATGYQLQRVRMILP